MRVVTASPIAKSVIAGQPAHRRDVDVDGGVIADPDREKAGRVMQAMYKMKKIIIADLERAYRG